MLPGVSRKLKPIIGNFVSSQVLLAGNKVYLTNFKETLLSSSDDLTMKNKMSNFPLIFSVVQLRNQRLKKKVFCPTETGSVKTSTAN